MVISKKFVAAIGTIGCLSLALLGFNPGAAGAMTESASEPADAMNPRHSSAILEEVEVTSNPLVAEVTSSDKIGRVSATITQPGQITPPISLPTGHQAAVGGRAKDRGLKKLSTAMRDTTIQTSALEDGMQTIIIFDSANAARDVTFKLEVTPNLTPIVRSTGAIDYLDSKGTAVAGLAAPWAIDANGRSVPTTFSLSGTSLVQHVEFDERTAFPVVADPQWWQMGISAAAGAAVGAAVVAAVPGVGPTVGGIVGGCVVGALNAMWDGADFWGGFWGCVSGAALGAVAGMVGSIVKNVLGSRGIGV
ncbi:hypothetical protein SPF06_02340 [Sinomonas sp. JGH33]|uniref:Glycine zipper domain-containing protein n=1 Tax=Sinomonas terricola TaxID=3110330 RepID=A0ABU5T1L1_9MICC|nr:hypothetical protein [Sinomonas sp. JGH33]MEA5453553.1 hypothetical protein [Sinomonas sp. JGH33]